MTLMIPQPLAEAYAERREETRIRRLKLRQYLRQENPALAKLDRDYRQAGFSLVQNKLRGQVEVRGEEAGLSGKDQDLQRVTDADLELLAEQLEAAYREAEEAILQADDLYFCPLCHDSGEYQGKLCSCAPLLLAEIEQKRGISFPLPHQDKLSDFELRLFSEQLDADYYQAKASPREMAAKFRDFAADVVATFPDKGRQLYFFGKTGTGKTWLATAIANELRTKGYGSAFISSADYLDLTAHLRTLDRTFSPDPTDYRITRDRIRYLETAPVLVLDDLGSENLNANAYSDLVRLMNRREALTSAVTLITGNLSPAELGRNYDERIGSRLIGNYQAFSFAGPDLRMTIRQQRRS